MIEYRYPLELSENDWMFLTAIHVFRYDGLLVRGIYQGTRRTESGMCFCFRIGLTTVKAYYVGRLRFLSQDLAQWCSEEQRMASLGEFNEGIHGRQRTF